MKGSLPKKFKSLREKNSPHRRSKSSEPGHKLRPISGESFFNYFRNDAQKQAAREEAEKAGIEANVDAIASRIEDLGFDDITKDHMRFALLSRYSQGDVNKAVELIQLQQNAFAGTVLPYNPNVEMQGAENRNNVTCYLDALLFAMYARLDAFECMLEDDQPNETQRNLAALIRLWVNMLRTGKLVRIDMTESLQEALARCGWQEARLLEQQDTSEAFAFITETLQLPLLTLQVDLFHHGKNDADDHKVVYERLLNLAVPPDPEGKGVKLEDCLEDYFNTRVDVLRDSPVEKRRSSSVSKAAVPPTETIRVVSPEQDPSTPQAPAASDAVNDAAINAKHDAGNDTNTDSSSSVGATVSLESENSTASLLATDSAVSDVTDVTSVAEASAISNSTDATIVPKGSASPEVVKDTAADVPQEVAENIADESSEETLKEATAIASDIALTTDGTSDTTATINTASGEDATRSASVPQPPATVSAPDTAEKPAAEAAPVPVSTAEPAAEAAPVPEANAATETSSKLPVEERHSESFDRDPAPVRRWTMLEPHKLTHDDRTASTSSDTKAFGRQRSESIIQRIVLDNTQSSTPHHPSFLQQFKNQGSTIIKAVTIPAWQFFRLVPWHSTSNRAPLSDVEVVRQFNKRPVVGICLKRYTMNKNGQFLRQNTYIDIPDSLRLPAFMMGEDGIPRNSDDISAEYKLVLQSVVCHRGVSLHSGHYISFARVDPKVLTDNRRHEVDPPPDYEDAQWLKFDDLNTGSRVTSVSDIKAALKEEMPYLLFYQIVPMMDGTAPKADEPPSYASTTSTAGTPQPSSRLDPNNPTAGYFSSSTWAGSTTTGPSVRFSSELERPPRFSLDEESTTSSSLVNIVRKTAEGVSRRGSAAFTSSIIGTPVITPEGGRSPVIAPTDEPTTAQRLSRAAARLTGKSQVRSRPPSQAGEGRISLTMSRLGGLVRSSKEPLRLFEEPSTDASTSTIPTVPLATSSTAVLTTVQTSPAAVMATSTTTSATTSAEQSQELLSAPDGAAPMASPSLPQLDGQDDRGQHHHHHHSRHHSHLGKKNKEAKDADADGSTAPAPEGAEPAAAGASKGKEKERSKVSRMGVPERECSIM